MVIAMLSSRRKTPAGNIPVVLDHYSALENDAAAMRQKAIESLDSFQQFADALFKPETPRNHSRHPQNIAPQSPEIEVGAACVKRKQRIIDKAEGDYGGNIDQVGDTIRLKVTCHSVKALKIARAKLCRQQDLAYARGITPERIGASDTPMVEKIGDYFADPKNHGYRAINVKVLLPNGLRGEIQIVHSAMEMANDYTHKPYEAMERLSRKVNENGGTFTKDQAEQYGRLANQISSTYDNIAAEHGLDSLLSPKGRDKLAKRQAWRAAFTAQSHHGLATEEILPPWKQPKTALAEQETLSQRLVAMGFEVLNNTSSRAEAVDQYAALTAMAQRKFSTLSGDEQSTIRQFNRNLQNKPTFTQAGLEPR